MKTKRMSLTKVMKSLRETRELLHRMYGRGNINGNIGDKDEALTEAIRLVKEHRKSIGDEKRFEKFGIRVM